VIYNDIFNKKEQYYYNIKKQISVNGLINSYLIYRNNSTSIEYYYGNFNDEYFNKLFIDTTQERKNKLKKLYHD